MIQKKIIEMRGCPTCDAIGWIEDVHPNGALARILPCPEACGEGTLMDRLLPHSERGWYLREASESVRPEVVRLRRPGRSH